MYNQNCTCHFKQAELRDTLRKLWEQHVMWTRSFIISTSSNLGDLTFVTNRLLQNPKDFADVLRPIYGRKKANEKTGHIARFSGNLMINQASVAASVPVGSARCTKPLRRQRVQTLMRFT